jgi:hypothetical protein
VAFNSTFWYIYDFVSININQFHSYVDSIYPNELEIKDTTQFSTSASYLDVLLKLDTDGKIIDWLITYGFTSHSRFFHIYGDNTIAGEGLQNLGLCSELRAFEHGGIFIVPHLL